MIALVLALALAQTPGDTALATPFATPPAFETWVSEDLGFDGLLAVAKLRQTNLAVETRSNMLRSDVAALLSKAPRSLVRVRAPLLEPHVDQLRKLKGTTLVVALPDAPDPKFVRALAALGRQTVRVQVKVLEPSIAQALATLKNVEVELDVRGRLPEQEELNRLLGLARAVRVVRLSASQPPELVAGLKLVRPARLVVEAVENRVPRPMFEALLDGGAPVRVSLDGDATADDVRRLAALSSVSIELRLERAGQSAVGKARALVEATAREAK